MTENCDATVYTLIIILFMGLMLFFVFKVQPFLEERKYIKMEMSRSVGTSEYGHWQREIKRLYIKLIPFVGKTLAKKVHR